MKLSKAQRDLIHALPRATPNYYAPARKLVELGLAKWVEGNWQDRLELTDAGVLFVKADRDAWLDRSSYRE